MSIATIAVSVPATGEGALVDVSSLVGAKTVVLTGRFAGIYELLASHDDSHFVPVLKFDAGGVEGVRQTVAGSFKSVRLRAATPGTSPLGIVTCEISGVSATGQNYFTTLASLSAGFTGQSPVVDLAPLFPPTGPEEDTCLICRGNLSGQLAVEGSLDGSRFCPVGSWRADRRPEGSPDILDLSVLLASDKVRYVRLMASDLVGAGGVQVTMGGRVPVSLVPAAGTRLTFVDAVGEVYVGVTESEPSSSQVSSRSSWSVVGGQNAFIDGLFVTALGQDINVLGRNVVSVGQNINISSGYVVAVGDGLVVPVDAAGSVMFGFDINCSGSPTVQVGSLLACGAPSSGMIQIGAGLQSRNSTGSITMIGAELILDGDVRGALHSVMIGYTFNPTLPQGAIVAPVSCVFIGDRLTVGALLDSCVLIGQYATAGDGSAHSIAIGTAASVGASSPSCLAIGPQTSVEGNTNTAIGTSVRVGAPTTATLLSHAVGSYIVVEGFFNTALGSNLTIPATAAFCLVMGYGSFIDPGTGAGTQYVIIAGHDSSVDDNSSYSILVGTNNRSYSGAGYSVFLGNSLAAGNDAAYSILVGTNNIINGTTSTDNTVIGRNITIGTTCSGVLAIGKNITVVAGTVNQCVIGGPNSYDSFRRFDVRGYNGVSLSTIAAVDDPSPGDTGLTIVYNDGATMTNKTIRAAVSPPLNSLILYVDP